MVGEAQGLEPRSSSRSQSANGAFAFNIDVVIAILGQMSSITS